MWLQLRSRWRSTFAVTATLVALCSSPSRAAPKRAAGHVAVKASTEMSGYTDTDAVNVLSPTVAASLADDLAGWTIGGRYLVDAVTAASVDIVSSASHRWLENRHVGSALADLKTDSLGVALSGGVSREPDYLSIGGGGTVSMELLEKNLTPFLGVSYGHDDVGRTGQYRELWRHFYKIGLQTGATFVVDRSTIASVAVDAIFERGYLAKPYRYIPLFAPGVGERLGPGASVNLVNQTRLDQRSADALPDSRDRWALSGRIAHRLDGATVRVDERLYRDNWGLLASTTDMRLTVDLGTRLQVWPHGRIHAQGGVSFWQRTYEAVATPDKGLAIPHYRTGDRELGPLQTLTVGGGSRFRLSADKSAPWTLGLEVDGIFTRYTDALYLTSRRAVFGALILEAEFN